MRHHDPGRRSPGLNSGGTWMSAEQRVPLLSNVTSRRRVGIILIQVGDCARNRFVMANDFTNDKGEELLGKIWVELADSEMPQTVDLLGFSSGIARGQPVLGLQFADRLGTPEPLR